MPTTFYRRNNVKPENLWQQIQSTTRIKSDPIRSEVKLSYETFTKDTFKLLNKNLNFIPTFKTNKQKLYIEMESSFRLVKLKAYFKDQF